MREIEEGSICVFVCLLICIFFVCVTARGPISRLRGQDGRDENEGGVRKRKRGKSPSVEYFHAKGSGY